MLTIGQIVKKYGLSRSTLIYYDKKGLLQPSGRSPANYRLYSTQDIQQLQRILMLRQTGLSLEAIQATLDKEQGHFDSILEQRLSHINQEIQMLRSQQRLIAQLLGKDIRIKARMMDKDTWVSVLEKTGLDDAGKRKWHQEFEAIAPEAHQDFLESLGIHSAEICSIRQWSKT